MNNIKKIILKYMNKAIELFNKILVDGVEISLQDLDANGGVYNVGEQKSNVKVDFVLKNKEEIPAKLFSGTDVKKVIIPQSVKKIGEGAFANTNLSYLGGIEHVEHVALDAFEGTSYNNDVQSNRYSYAEAYAYNINLDGARKYDAIKVPSYTTDAIVYTDAEVEEHNAQIEGAVKIGDPSESIFIDDYDKIEYIYNEETWNQSYANGIMKKYYETYPDEDWYNETAHRAANFNDKAYDVDIYESADTIYDFTSYNNADKEVKYGEGQVKVIEMRAGGATVEVISNTATDPNAANFVGQRFNVALATGADADAPIQLHTLDGEAVDIWVVVSEVGPIQKEISFKAGWVADNVQSLTNRSDSSEVYYTDMFYSLDVNKHELFTDSACTTSANKFAIFNTVSFPECVHCWEGVVTAPNAKLPWVGVWFKEDLQVTIIYQYEGKEDVRPWDSSKIFGLKENGHKEWGFASPATEFGDNTLAIAENGGKNAFDMNKFHLRLEKLNPARYDKDGANAVNANVLKALQYGAIKTPSETIPAVLYTKTEVDEYNLTIPGAVKPGDIKPTQE